MIVVEILWHIRVGKEEDFRQAWREKYVVADRTHLIGEFLSAPVSDVPDMYKSWKPEEVGDPKEPVSVFVNVAMWTSLDAFKAEIEKYIPKPGQQQPDFVVNRYRIVLAPVDWRVGNASLPSVDSAGTR